MPRTARPSRKAAAVRHTAASASSGSESSDEDQSVDEYQPEAEGSRGQRRKAFILSDSYGDGDDDNEVESSSRPAAHSRGAKKAARTQSTSDAAAATRAKKGAVQSSQKPAAPRQKQQRRSTSAKDEQEDKLLRAEQGLDDGAERAAAQKEAEELWKHVRERKNGGGAQGFSSVPDASKVSAAPASTSALGESSKASLRSWLGSSDALQPTTCDEATVFDRDSLFVGFVWDLDSTSPHARQKLLSHLTHVVQPRIPGKLLPQAMRHLNERKRGATHDMLAWRVLALKPGRDGLGGPGDFGLEQGEDDDGEKGGGRAVMKAITTSGATDVLVVVSRWYGGAMLGPVRFEHIENAARAALSKHMIAQTIRALRDRLINLDSEISAVKAKAGLATAGSPDSTNAYLDLSLDKAERLVRARQLQLDNLLRPRQPTKSQAEVPLEDLDAAQRALAVLPP